jgi:hypothetical protein
MMPVWIATLTALDKNNQPVTLRFSDGAYIDSQWHYYEPRMLQPALVKISPDDGGVLPIFSAASIGEIELINVDGELNYLADYAFDNGSCTLSLVDEHGSIRDYLVGKILTSHCQNHRVYLTLKSMSEVLTRTHPMDKYAGNNVLPDGVEGLSSDLKGNIKPKVFGQVQNATPVLVNTARQIYQFSSRDSCTVLAVYDKGVALTLAATYSKAQFDSFLSDQANPPAGYFNRCMGFVRLGATPVGTLTGDACEESALAGDVFCAILQELNLRFDATSQALLNSTGKVGLLVKNDTSTSNLLNQIVASCGAYWFFEGEVVFAHLIGFASAFVLELTDSEIISIERSATGIGNNGVPIAACSLQYGKIETVQNENDLAGSVSVERKAQVSQAFCSTFLFDAQVMLRHQLAGSIKIDSVLLDESCATAVAARLLNLFKHRVDVVSITAVVAQVPNLTLGVGILVFSNRLGYQEGKLLTLTGFEIDAKRKRITLECIG